MNAQEQPNPSMASESRHTQVRRPPLLPAGGSWRVRTVRWTPVWAMLGMLALLGTVTLVQRFELPWPQCGLRTLTGIPCAFCGSTRCLNAVARWHWAQAIAFNPLVAIACCGFTAWFGLWLLDRLRHGEMAVGIARRLTRKPWPQVLIGLVILNWIYLILYLPK